jgi:uncharacterized membrane protein HdeD (DUF308 family)
MATINSSATAAGSAIPADVAAVLQHRWGWLLALGIVQFLCGSLALAVPVVASLAAVAIFGGVLLASAVFQLIHAFKVKNWKGAALHTLGGLMYAAAGIITLMFPFGGAMTLTLLLATLFIVDGGVRCALALQVRPGDGWGWLLGAGIVSIFVGMLLFIGWPASALWAIGTLLGINLLFSGATNVALALTFRSALSHLSPGSGARATPHHA